MLEGISISDLITVDEARTADLTSKKGEGEVKNHSPKDERLRGYQYIEGSKTRGGIKN